MAQYLLNSERANQRRRAQRRLDEQKAALANQVVIQPAPVPPLDPEDAGVYDDSVPLATVAKRLGIQPIEVRRMREYHRASQVKG